MTQRGPVWFVEAMFPGYLFAKFVYSTQHRAVENSHGIRGIVHFGDRLATLPENIVAELQSRVGSEQVMTLDCSIKIGQSVEVMDGPWKWKFRRQKCSQRKADLARYSGLQPRIKVRCDADKEIGLQLSGSLPE